MKTKILLIATLASLIFISCQKEDESKNPYNTGKTYTLTTDDLKYLPYKDKDTVNFEYKSVSDQNSNGSINAHFFNKIDSGFIEIAGNKYEFIKVQMDYYPEGNYKNYTLQKTKTGINFIVENIQESLYPNHLFFKLETPKAFYNTITLNGITYTDVYMYQYDANGNYTDTTLYHKYYFAKDEGLVCFQENMYINFKTDNPTD